MVGLVFVIAKGTRFISIDKLFFIFSVSGVDIVLNHRLVETGFGDKKGFTAYLKAYMKKVLGYLEENDRKDEIAEFKSNINNVMKEMMGKFKDLQFYTGKTSHC